MGIRLFSSKKFWICIGILGAIASLVSILEFLIKIKILKLLLSLLVMIINLKIPDIIFVIIVLAFLFWLILINRKLKKLPLPDERKSKTVPEIKEESEKIKEEIKPKKEKKKLLLTRKQLYILALIADSKDMMSASSLLEVYERRYPDVLLVHVKSIIIWLEKNGLIWHSDTIMSEFYYRATDDGIEYVSESFDKHGT